MQRPAFIIFVSISPVVRMSVPTRGHHPMASGISVTGDRSMLMLQICSLGPGSEPASPPATSAKDNTTLYLILLTATLKVFLHDTITGCG